jgi:hypothetical protein
VLRHDLEPTPGTAAQYVGEQSATAAGAHVKIGMVGLGRMGGNMAERLRRGDHEVVGYDTSPGARDVDSLEALVAALADQPRRVVWVMVPAGDPTEATIRRLAELLDAGRPDRRRRQRQQPRLAASGQELASAGIRFVDAGVSGGVWGLELGYCIMAGGRPGGHRPPAAPLRRAGHRPAASRTSAPSVPATSRRWCTTASSTPSCTPTGRASSCCEPRSSASTCRPRSRCGATAASCVPGCSTCSRRPSPTTPGWPPCAVTRRTPARGAGPSRRRSTWPCRPRRSRPRCSPASPPARRSRPAMQAVAVLRDRFGGHGTLEPTDG